jgi:DNA-3-methyladenine glycosylase I
MMMPDNNLFRLPGDSMPVSKGRCFWASGDDFYIRYHDEEWGVPVHDDRMLFEFLILEGFQAGLSWHCILKKRENFREAFDGFDPLKVSKYGKKKIEALMQDAGIIRNRLKIQAAVSNAKAFLGVQKEFGSFDRYIWGFVRGKPIINRWKAGREIPAKTELAEKISKDLKARGFKFVGPTVVYAHMQATGMVNDHLTSCFRWKEVQE